MLSVPSRASDASVNQSVDTVPCRPASRSGTKTAFALLVPLRMPKPWGLTLLHCSNPRRASVDVCAWEKTPPQLNLLDFVSQSSKPESKKCFSKSPTTIFQIKKEFGTILCSRFMSMGISILHLNKTEQQSFRRILETTG